jgi:hypothetical protein
MGYRQPVDSEQSGNATSRRLWRCAVLLAFLYGGGQVSAQTPLYGRGQVSAQTPPSRSEQMQAAIKEVARVLQDNPRLKNISQQKRETLVEFVMGNMLFVLLHELGHATMEELRIPVLGREEDAADDFAILRLLKARSDMPHRVLVDAAKGWFLSHRRDQRNGEGLVFYDEHSLDKQRAYHIVCLMVGSDPSLMVDLADEEKLPSDRRESCHDHDFPMASWSWETELKRVERAADQTKTKIDVVYGDGKGGLDVFAQGFRSVRLLERPAEWASEEFAWPSPFTLEMQTCGFTNARWVRSTRKLTLCYELAQDFADLYREFNLVNLTPANPKRKSK